MHIVYIYIYTHLDIQLYTMHIYIYICSLYYTLRALIRHGLYKIQISLGGKES